MVNKGLIARLTPIVLAKTVSGMVSVVMPIYGVFNTERTLLAIDSIKAQKGVEFEIVISEQNETPKFQHLAELMGVRYVFEQHIPLPHLSDFDPGRVRNNAVSASKGEFLYTNDADVLFQNSFYLRDLTELLKENPDLALYRPPMRRLLLECFEEFKRRASEKGVSEALDSLNRRQEYIAKTDDVERVLKVVTKNKGGHEKTFTTSWEDFQRYLSDPSLKGAEPTIWTQDLHCGGNFIRRAQYDLVGGYSQEFVNWGCEDSDLQWKLSEVFDLMQIPYERRFEVLHLDHPKGYFAKEMWKRNEEISARRKQEGVITAITTDRRSK